jgi:hypothetical protein
VRRDDALTARGTTVAKILRALGEQGAMLVPNGVVRVVQESKNPASGASDAGFANAPQVHPLQAPISS